jgi:MinD superfamily P-loop ATPase
LNIAIVSGKGGSGKTTLAVNLFSYLKDAALIDADTEAPNDHLYFQEEASVSNVYKEVPRIDPQACTLCHACANMCAFHAIVPTKQKILVFEDLCHDCHGCHLVCDAGAIDYQAKAIGVIETRLVEGKPFFTGRLKIGEQSGNKIIEEMKSLDVKTKHTILDGPPGVSCKTVETLRGVDYVILVMEDGLFGLHDANMVIELLEELKLPFGLVLNKVQDKEEMAMKYIRENDLNLLVSIPYSEDYQVLGSEGKLLTSKNTYRILLDQLIKEVGIV